MILYRFLNKKKCYKENICKTGDPPPSTFNEYVRMRSSNIRMRDGRVREEKKRTSERKVDGGTEIETM